MNELDENYLDLVRVNLYNAGHSRAAERNIKPSKARKEKKNKAEQDSPKNKVKEGYKTKKEVFKAKAKLRKRSEIKTKPKHVTFSDNSNINEREEIILRQKLNRIKCRIATPFKNPKTKVHNKANTCDSNGEMCSTISEDISPSLNEYDASNFKDQTDLLDNRNISVNCKNPNFNSKKRKLSLSDSPEISIKRKKEKNLKKKGERLIFYDSSDDNDLIRAKQETEFKSNILTNGSIVENEIGTKVVKTNRKIKDKTKCLNRKKSIFIDEAELKDSTNNMGIKLNALEPKNILGDSNVYIQEKSTILSDFYDNETVGVKRLEFQQFCNQFHNILNDQLLSYNVSLNIPEKHFLISQNDYEQDSLNEEISSYLKKKSNDILTCSEICLQKNMNSTSEDDFKTSMEANDENNDNYSDESCIVSNKISYKVDQSGNQIQNNSPLPKKPTILTLNNGDKVVILTLNQKCFIHGLCLIKVIHGEIEILGGKITKESGEKKFYSPRGSALLYVKNESVLIATNIIRLKDLLSPQFMQADDAELSFEYHTAIFVCSELKEHYIEFVENYISQKIFPECIGRQPRIDFDLQGIWNRFNSSANWEGAIENVTESSRIIISGGKGVGKSTLLRYTLNFLQNKFKKVRVVDLDPGQSEFYPPGCLSITTVNKEVFGPNYTHLMKPDSLILSHINITYDIEKYLKSVQCILEFISHSSEVLPTIINFPGFTQGLGYDISVQSLKVAHPNLVIQINSKSFNKNYKSDLTCERVNKYFKESNVIFENHQQDDNHLAYDFVKLDSLSENNEAWSLEARQSREINILSYFGQMMTDTMKSFESENVNMFRIRISSLSLTDLEGKEVSPLSINANLVALCSKLDQSSSLFSCYGYGFVRGMDPDVDILVLITPENIETMENVSHLVLSSISVPPSLLMTTNLKGHIPYISVGSLIDLGQFTKRPYLPPVK